MAGEPDWRVWALWLALQLHLALGRGARPEDREAERPELREAVHAAGGRL